MGNEPEPVQLPSNETVNSLKGRMATLLPIFFEAAIFVMFYLIQVNTYFYYLYIGATPLIFLLASVYIKDVRNAIYKVLLHKDLTVLLTVILVWLFLFAATHNGSLYVLETAYYPVFLEEFNFRFLLITFLRRKLSFGQSIVIQAMLYSLFYASFLVFYPSGFPGVFLELFILDNFSMAIVYGVLYYFRKNFYIATSLHLSLYMMSVFLPASLGWLPQVTTPV